ncbi:MAG: HD domain-containing protein [Bdellovibrionaceae bacterium]|nr:HD domain-containing protein [Pseudobdellovibrionaceae bacterium]
MPISINDPIHINIDLTDEEERIINHVAFQRLRRIKALGFLDRVFPSAKHSRFEHSIGACHVAGVIFNSIGKVTRDQVDHDWVMSSVHTSISIEECDKIFTDNIRRCLRIAALMHDVGHGPFSHASESIMPSLNEVISNNQNMSPFIKVSFENKNSHNENADHEDYSLLILDKILRDLEFNSEDIHLIASLKSKYVKCPEGFDPDTISLLRTLIDGEIDSDRMDYLLRDSYFCGVPYGNYDLKRLQEGLCIVKERKSNKKLFSVLRKSITAFEDFLFSRFQMHVQIYTHKIDASCNSAFKKMAEISGYKLPSTIEEYILIDDENILEKNVQLKKTLGDMILNRKLWLLAIQSYSNDRSCDIILFEKIINSIGKEHTALYLSERPFKKQKLLDFPVLTKAVSGQLMTEKMRKTSELIAHYNAIFSVQRLFYKPEFEVQVKQILKSIETPIVIDADLLKEKRSAAKKVSKATYKKVGDKKEG